LAENSATEAGDEPSPARARCEAAERVLVGRGRDAEVFAIDDETVLRRYRARDVPDEEVAIMRHVHARGFPAPAVVRVAGRDLVLERIHGPTMRTAIERDPTTLREHARTLARLHLRLGEVVAPPWLEAIGPGDRVVHLDLHPENVMLSPRGPVVIDWANARRGHGHDDVAQTVVILAGALLDDHHREVVRSFVDAFLEPFDRNAVRPHVAAAIARRVADPNLDAREREAAKGVTL
jgi:tRNA A-37 threonylcarbamoyl transferase component Bud32